MQSSTAVLRRVKEPHWRSLRLMVVFLKFIACLNLLAGIGMGTLIVLEMFKMFPLPVVLFPAEAGLPILMVYLVGAVLAGLLSFFVFDGLAEFILLLVAIEFNTRRRSF